MYSACDGVDVGVGVEVAVGVELCVGDCVLVCV